LHPALIVFLVCLFDYLIQIIILSFKEIPTSIFGDRLKQQVTDRLKFYDSGELPAKNVDVMQLALQEAEVEREEILTKERKRKKKEKKRRKEADNHANGTTALEQAVNKMEVA
jgi:nucleolar protein 56